MRRLLAPFFFCLVLVSCGTDNPELTELNRKQARFAPVELRVDTTKLDAGDQQALVKILEAAGIIDELFRTQVWSGNAALREKLAADASDFGKARLRYFDLNQPSTGACPVLVQT